MISAIGDVEVINANEILRARELTYDFKSDIILAKGKVSLKTKEWDILYADTMELKGNLKSGVIKNFSSILNDGSRLSASKIIRDIENGDRLEKVIYTKCEICEDSPDEFPIWQLRALKSKRNVEEGRIEYNHVILDAYGFPLFYFPAIMKKKNSILSLDAIQKTTKNHIIVMGRKTFESLPNGPLKNRINVVITNQTELYENSNETLIYTNFENSFALLETFQKETQKEVFIIGGNTIYQQYFEYYKRLLLNHFHIGYLLYYFD